MSNDADNRKIKKNYIRQIKTKYFCFILYHFIRDYLNLCKIYDTSMSTFVTNKKSRNKRLNIFFLNTLSKVPRYLRKHDPK